MEYVYILKKDNTLDYYVVYNGETLEDNQTLIRPADGLYNATFNRNTQQWEEGIKIEPEPPKELTKEEELRIQMERDKKEMISKYEAKELVEDAITSITSMMFGL